MNDTLAAGNLIKLYADEIGELAAALELGERHLDPATPNIYTALAGVYEKLDRLDEAQRLYEQAIEFGALLHT